MIRLDIQMPRCCDDCFALDDNGDYPTCHITHTSRGYTFNTREKRMPDCPLIEEENEIGEWLPVDDKNDAWDCSFCGAMVGRKTNYCPRCGRRMR